MSGNSDQSPLRLTLADPTTPDTPNSPATGPDRVETELTAMASIADALLSVGDDAARFRVLRWAVELYASNADAGSRKQDAAGDLSLDLPPVLNAPVRDVVETPLRTAEPPSRPLDAPVRAAANAPYDDALDRPFDDAVEASMRAASDPTLVVGDLQSLFAADDDDDDLDLLALEEKRKPVDDLPVHSMIERFVKDFQKLARDWEKA